MDAPAPLDASAHASLASPVIEVAERSGYADHVPAPLHPPSGDDLLFRGWVFDRRQRRRSKLPLKQSAVEFHLERGASVQAEGRTRIADLRYIWLRDGMQRRGLGTALLGRLLAEWADLDVAEVHACVGSLAGRRLLERFGFEDTGHLVVGLPQWARALA